MIRFQSGWPGVGLGLLLSAVPFLGWTKSGTVIRNSFETFRAAQILGLDQLTPLRVLWFVVPVVPSLMAALLLVHRKRAAGGVLFIHALIVGSVAGIVLLSDVAGGAGPTIGALLGVAGTGYAVYMIWLG